MTPSPSLNKTLILVVDDDPRILDLLINTLKTKGYFPLAARNGKEGLEIFRSKLPAIVLTDLMLPVMDGFALVKEIRKSERGSDAFIIIMSAVYRDLKIIQKTVFDYKVEFLLKPFSLKELYAKLKLARLWRKGKRRPPEPASKGGEIHGHLQHFSFPILLVNLYAHRRTGILKVRREKQIIKIYMENGLPIFAEARERKVDRQAVVKLIEGIFHWASGEFFFEAWKQIPKEIPRHPYDLYSLIYKGAKKYYRLETLIDRFLQFQSFPIIRQPGFGTKIQLVGFTEEELALVNEIDNQKTVSDLVTLRKDRVKEVFQILWILQFMEVISFKQS